MLPLPREKHVLLWRELYSHWATLTAGHTVLMRLCLGSGHSLSAIYLSRMIASPGTSDAGIYALSLPTL